MENAVFNFGMDTEEVKSLNLLAHTKEIISYGESTRFLPLPFKKMWFRSKNPHGAIRYSALSDSEEYVYVEARVYEDKTDPDEAYIGIGYADCTPDKCADNMSLTPIERHAYMLATARGLAASKALADAGYGLQFYGDLFDPEAIIAEKQKNEQEQSEFNVTELTPTSAPEALPQESESPSEEPAPKEKKTKKSDKSKEESTEQPVTVENPLEEAPIEEESIEPSSFTDTKTSSEDTSELVDSEPSVEISSSESKMSLEEAMGEVVTIGPLKGYKLGDALKSMPNYALYLNGQKDNIPARLYEALWVVIESDPKLQRRIDSVK